MLKCVIDSSSEHQEGIIDSIWSRRVLDEAEVAVEQPSLKNSAEYILRARTSEIAAEVVTVTHKLKFFLLQRKFLVDEHNRLKTLVLSSLSPAGSDKESTTPSSAA